MAAQGLDSRGSAYLAVLMSEQQRKLGFIFLAAECDSAREEWLFAAC